jgi:hypothetical protein
LNHAASLAKKANRPGTVALVFGVMGLAGTVSLIALVHLNASTAWLLFVDGLCLAIVTVAIGWPLIVPIPPDGGKPIETRKGMETNLPNGISEQAGRAREQFEAMYQRLLRGARNVALNILVWGPNPQSGSPVAMKRIGIRDELCRLGHNAMFNEDLPDPAGEVSAKTKEFAEARAAQLIIDLVEGAPGASAEAHDFCNDPNIAPNMYVMIPTKYKDGYSAQGAIMDLDNGYGGVYWYADGELESCIVLKKAVKRAEARRQIIYRQGLREDERS